MTEPYKHVPCCMGRKVQEIHAALSRFGEYPEHREQALHALAALAHLDTAYSLARSSVVVLAGKLEQIEQRILTT